MAVHRVWVAEDCRSLDGVSSSVSETLDQDAKKGILHISVVAIYGLFHSLDPTGKKNYG